MRRTLCCCQLASRVLTGHIGISGDETRLLAGRMEFPHHQGEYQCSKVTPRVLTGPSGISRGGTRGLFNHRMLAGHMVFTHRQGDCSRLGLWVLTGHIGM